MKGGILILVLAFMVGSACCLSVGEIETLQKIYESSFGLRAVDPPWNSNASSACDPPGFYGVSCSPGPDPHILSLYVAVLQLLGKMSVFTFPSSLTLLCSFSTRN